MSVKIIALMGSPLPEGNTGVLLEEAARGARDAGCSVARVNVCDLNISGCMEYYYCEKKDSCYINDEFSPFLQRFKNMDGLIIATPVMTMGIPGQLKSFMDRFQVYFMAKYVRKQPIISEEQKKWRRTLLISIGGMNIKNDFDGIKLTTESFCDIIDSPYYDGVFQNNMDEVKDITTRAEVMKAAYNKSYQMCSEIIEDKEKYSKEDPVP